MKKTLKREGLADVYISRITPFNRQSIRNCHVKISDNLVLAQITTEKGKRYTLPAGAIIIEWKMKLKKESVKELFKK